MLGAVRYLEVEVVRMLGWKVDYKWKNSLQSQLV